MVDATLCDVFWKFNCTTIYRNKITKCQRDFKGTCILEIAVKENLLTNLNHLTVNTVTHRQPSASLIQWKWIYFGETSRNYLYHSTGSGLTCRSPSPLSSLFIHSFTHPSVLCPRVMTPLQQLAGGRLTSPPSVLLCSWSCLLSLLHFYPSPSSLEHCSSSLPLPHPSLSRGLSDLPGGHHGNLHPGHPLQEPLRDPVRPL